MRSPKQSIPWRLKPFPIGSIACSRRFRQIVFLARTDYRLLLLGAFNFFIHRLVSPPPGIAVLNTITVSGGGLLITSLYRTFLKRRPGAVPSRAGRFLAFVFGSSAVLAFAWFLVALMLFLPFLSRYSLTILNLVSGSINFFFFILAWNLLYLGYRLVRNYHRSEVEKWQLAAEVQKAQFGALKAQMAPHFMFNALNNIRALILEDAEAARKMITQFSEILRYSLQFAEFREVALSEEIGMLLQYVDLLKIQYERRLDFGLAVNDAVTKHQVPPMILQMLVENAVKHGIALSADGGKIRVAIDGGADRLTIQVRNTGTLRQSNVLEESLGVGTANLGKRLQLLYGGRASLQIEEDAPMVVVTIQIAYT